MSKKEYKYNEDFEPMKTNIEDTTYGLCPAPMDANVALKILISYLLGDNWYVAMPMSQAQCNACAAEQILDKYSRKWKKDWKHFEKSWQK